MLHLGELAGTRVLHLLHLHDPASWLWKAPYDRYSDRPHPIATIYLGLSLHIAPLFVPLIMAGFAGISGGIIDTATNGLINTLFVQRGA
jgi:hypothetical protein